MKTLKNTKKKTGSTLSRIFQALLVLVVLCIASDVYSQTKEVEFDVYTTSVSKASKYLLADDVSLRDCPSVQCEQLTTINIGTNVRLLAKSETPQTISGVKSRWYKIKMGSQVGWIWGGMISQKTMTSSNNPEIKFVVGEAGFDYRGHKQFQVRAIKNGVQIDKIVFQTDQLDYETVSLLYQKDVKLNRDVIALNNSADNETYIVFEDNTLQKTNSLVVSNTEKPLYTGLSYVICTEDEN